MRVDTHDFPSNEIGANEHLISEFTGGILRRAREVSEDKWNWSFSERTPAASEICQHAWIWNDRQEVTVLDPALQVPVPCAPAPRPKAASLRNRQGSAARTLNRLYGDGSPA